MGWPNPNAAEPTLRPLAARVAVCSWSLKPESPAHLIDRLKRLDLQAVQLALTPIVNNPTTWCDTIEALRAAGITIVSGMMAMAGEDYSTLQSIARTGGLRPNETWPANQRHALAVADLAERCSIPLVTFHAGFIPEDDGGARAMIVERLGLVADAFARRGCDLALETGQESAATLLHALAELARANVGVNFDPANMILYGKGDPVEALRALAPRVRQIHIKDALPSPPAAPGSWGREVPVGQGAVDWDAFFKIARAIQPPVNFVIEREGESAREADIAAARDLIRRHLGAT